MPLTIAIQGCAHGELDKIYETIGYIEKEHNIKVDLLLCCGDFQAVRSPADLESMAVPPKYREMQSFYKYYSKEIVAPVLTIFVGGNHESANHLWELGYGGWAAPNIYFMGIAGMLNFGGIRLGGVSGIYKKCDFFKGHYEHPPFNESTLRSFYHTRCYEMFQMLQIKRSLDIFLSHDWPNNITDYGNRQQLVKFKPAFHSDIEKGELGCPAKEKLLFSLKPSYWFSAHLHCKFAALVPHEPEDTSENNNDDEEASDAKRQKRDCEDEEKDKKEEIVFTKFLALNKCLPGRQFLQILTLPECDGDKVLSYDSEWLSILKSTNEFFPSTHEYWQRPSCEAGKRWIFTPTEVEMEDIRKLFRNDLTIPNNFAQTVEIMDSYYIPQENPQTTDFCAKLNIVNKYKPIVGPLQRPISIADLEIPQLSTLQTIPATLLESAQKTPGPYTPFSPADQFPNVQYSPLALYSQRNQTQTLNTDDTNHEK